MREGSPPEFVEQVRVRTDIVEVVSQYLELKKAGKNYVGLCPFHPDRRPSLSVSPDRQMFYCFACGAGGDVFAFLMKREGISFGEALRLLARRAGIPWPERYLTPAQEARVRRRRRLLEALAAAAAFFQRQLWQEEAGEVARSYLASRGIAPPVAEKFGLGYAPAGWEGLGRALAAQGFHEQELVEAGLAVPREGGKGCYDRFRHRLTFPICDLQGQVVAFGGRALDDSLPKYLNSPESLVFQKSSCWYGLYQAREGIRRRGEALVVEGYLDALTAHQFGFDWAVASMGTSLTREQARLLQGFCSQAVICYDADAAGQAATWRSLDLFRELGLRVRVASLPEGEDPDSWLRSSRGGPAEFARVLEQALPLVEYRLEAAMKDTDTVEGKLAAVANIIPLLADISNAVEQEAYLRRAAKRLEVSEEALWRELGSYRRRRGKHKAGASRERIAEMTEVGSRPALVKAEEMLVRLMLQDPAWVEAVRARAGPEDFRHGVWREIAAAILEAASAEPPGPEGHWGRRVAVYLESEEALSALARVQVEQGEITQPQRVLADCLAVLEEERTRRRLEELRELIAAYESRKEPVPPPVLEEYQELLLAGRAKERRRPT